MLAAQSVQLGQRSVVAAGGMESMSNAPKASDRSPRIKTNRLPLSRDLDLASVCCECYQDPSVSVVRTITLPPRLWRYMLLEKSPNLESLEFISFLPSTYRLWNSDPIFLGTWPKLKQLTLGCFNPLFPLYTYTGPRRSLRVTIVAIYLGFMQSLEEIRDLEDSVVEDQ
ncbi:hypothetical protein K435DRAFT_873664 [Dendrothele bispora CBS 962.96]|uniref:Uncharacterized protein n=1 Tax=Dendrothele bispora (strain CBS 962.96) TaxID=1314807 RepID=A0A4S8KYL3_DENBC|nr:hypothetical protein K435DRAFT_873664 [Dendrothele bispora CBS 962.96]